MSRFIVLLALVGCQSDPVVVAHPRSSEVAVAPAPIAAKMDLPAYDESLDSPEKVSAWQSDVIAKADAYAALPDPEEIQARYAPYFKLKAKMVAQPLGNAAVWDAPAQKTRADAAALEANSEEYEAGRIYASLGDKDSVRRCSGKLAGEAEWAAVAKLAYLIGDEGDSSNPRNDNWSVGMEDVLLFARKDKVRALELGRAISPTEWEASSSVIVRDGEGCWGGAVAGTLELYQVAKLDAGLKESYLQGVRSWPQMGGGVGGVVTYCGFNDLGALLVRVRKLNDADLTRAWGEALQPVVEDEGMVNYYRSLLGLPGEVPDANLFAIGTLSAADQKKLQAEFGIEDLWSAEAVRAAIVMRIEALSDAAIGPQNVAGVALSNAMFMATDALWANQTADSARIAVGEAPRHVMPHTQEELDAMMEPVNREFATKGISGFEAYITTGP